MLFRHGPGLHALGYLGVVNQGATCYMNSLLQQLYMTPSFRLGILLIRANNLRYHMLNLKLPQELKVRDSLVYQLQILFATLQVRSIG